MIEFAYKKQGDGTDSWSVKEFKDGELVNAFMIYETPIQYLTKKLSEAFDKRFEIEWRAKGYSDLHDLNNHAVDIKSIHNNEALSLIKWANASWESISANLNENSNIEDLINNLTYNG